MNFGDSVMSCLMANSVSVRFLLYQKPHTSVGAPLLELMTDIRLPINDRVHPGTDTQTHRSH